MAEDRVDLYEEFYALTDALSAANIPYAVCGGVAVSIHGYTRFTKDIDFLILPADERWELRLNDNSFWKEDDCRWVRVKFAIGRSFASQKLLAVTC